jgi:hypothetical protein
MQFPMRISQQTPPDDSTMGKGQGQERKRSTVWRTCTYHWQLGAIYLALSLLPRGHPFLVLWLGDPSLGVQIARLE